LTTGPWITSKRISQKKAFVNRKTEVFQKNHDFFHTIKENSKKDIDKSKISWYTL